MNFSHIWLAKDAGCLAGSQGFCKSKMAEIQLSGGDESFFRVVLKGDRRPWRACERQVGRPQSRVGRGWSSRGIDGLRAYLKENDLFRLSAKAQAFSPKSTYRGPAGPINGGLPTRFRYNTRRVSSKASMLSTGEFSGRSNH